MEKKIVVIKSQISQYVYNKLQDGIKHYEERLEERKKQFENVEGAEWINPLTGNKEKLSAEMAYASAVHSYVKEGHVGFIVRIKKSKFDEFVHAANWLSLFSTRQNDKESGGYIISPMFHTFGRMYNDSGTMIEVDGCLDPDIFKYADYSLFGKELLIDRTW